MKLHIPFGGALLIAATAVPVGAAELPVPCVAGSCGSKVPGFVTSGQVTATNVGNTLTVQQKTDRAILNWASFNIGADGKVIFNQPDVNSIALNRIFQDSPSKIFGTLQANGQIYLVNPNGILFGANARVNTAGLLASTLNISDSTFKNGLLSKDLAASGNPALASDGRPGVLDADGNPVLGSDGKPLKVEITVENGAQITTASSGQRVMLAGQNINNAGTISAPDGQVVLAAGEKVYLSASADPALRGLLVEVDAGGKAWNQLTGNISAARGNVTVVGLAVNQDGRVSASSTVNANGSIRLLARDTVELNSFAGTVEPTRGGKLTLGAQSVTSVLPELDSKETAVDEQVPVPSNVTLQGQQVLIKGGAQVVVPGGVIAASATKNPRDVLGNGIDPDSRIRVESGAVLDVSGSDAELPASANMVTVELRANELRDSPLQRDGALRGKTVIVDRRVGTPLADVSGAIAALPKTIAERTSKGGSITLDSEGDVVVADGARMDVSGGKITYAPGEIQTTKLIGADGKLVDIGEADPNKIYVGLLNPTSKKTYDRWGVTETIKGPSLGQFDRGYVQGSDAGTLQFTAYNMVLNGDFLGSTTAGQYQRDPASMPAGGRFIIGYADARPKALALVPDYRAPSVVFTDTRPRISVSSDAQLSGPRTLELPTDFLSQGFTRTEIYSNGDVVVPESLALDLAPGSSFTLQGHGVEVYSDIRSAGGQVSLASVRAPLNPQGSDVRGGVRIADNVTLDVSGLWTNDLTALNAGRVASDPLAPDAGSISITVGDNLATGAGEVQQPPAELILGDGVQLLANGGAWVKSQTTTVGGKGGSISLRAGEFESPIQIGDKVGLAAFGVNGATGGSFTLEAPRIDIGHDSVWSHAQSIAVNDAIVEPPGSGSPDLPPPQPKPPAKFVLGDGLFSDYGFAKFSLTATGAGVALDNTTNAPVVTFDVLSNARIDTRVRTLLLSDDARNIASGANLGSFSSRALLPETQRQASSVSMRVAPRAERFGPAGNGWLRVEAGSSMLGDAQSTFSFAAQRGVLLAGDITAHAGSVSASLGNPALGDDAGYLADQRIEIAPSAHIDLSGIALFAPNDRNLQQGSVLDGGKLSLSAARGSVLINQGAIVDVSGTQAAIDFTDSTAPSGYRRQFVASGAGSVALSAPESVQISGTLSAHAGRGDTGAAQGGTLSVAITRDSFLLPDGPIGASFPKGPRVVRVVGDSNFSSDQNGVAVVSAGKVISSGFDSLSLLGGDRIEFEGDVSLALGRQLSLDAPVISAGTASKVDLSAPYILWGYSPLRDNARPATPGGAQLTVRADTIELYGISSLAGFANARFEAQHDLRMRDSDINAAKFGTLRANGNLTLAASRLFPLSGMNFEIRATGNEEDDTGTVRIEQVGTSSGTPLSAGGSLSIFARNIVQGGTVLAPFGTLSLNASDTLTLLGGSVTSVSAAGATIPYGFVQSGTDWLYGSNRISAIPDREITLTGPTVRTESGSTIDLRGGGDLYAYEWVPGTGGKTDRLKAGTTPGLYAIIPADKAPYAAIDPLELQNSGLRAGDSVYLAGTPDIPAGTYALLPARYALLPGAYLVNASSGGTDIRPGMNSTLPDGGVTVAGFRTFADTGIGATRFSTFVVHPGSYGRQIAGYEDHLASKFFPDNAIRFDRPPPAIPANAGSLILNPGKQLDARGDVLTAAAEGGLRADISITAPNLAVTAERVAYASPQISADTLQKWNPRSLLLGGTSSLDDDDERQVSVVSDRVIIGRNVNLSLDEIVVVANGGISLEDGAKLSSRSASAASAVATPDAKLNLAGTNAAGASVLAVSDLARYEVERPDGAPAASARVDLAAGSQLASRGSLLLDAPGGARLDGTLSGNGAAWNLSSAHVVFGEVDDVDDGLVIDSRLSALLNQGRSLQIASSGAMDFAESLTVGGSGLEDLTLRAQTLRALDPGTDVVFAAETLTLEGGKAASSALLASDASSLTVKARDILLGPGFLDLDGFGTASLVASRDVRGEGTSLFRLPGSLDVTAQRFTTNTGANTGLDVAGRFRMLQAAGVSNGELAGLGGSLKVHAGEIEQSGLIEMPTGLVSLTADHGLTLSANSVIDVSGRTVTAAGRSASSWGGAIRLGAGEDLVGIAGSKLLMQGAGAADAGNLSLTSGGMLALDSTLDAHGTNTTGSVIVDAGTITDFAALNARFEASGFYEARRITVAHGDLNLAAGTTTTARAVELTTNDGSINVAGSIVALSDSQRASIALFGANGVTLASGASLRAEGTGPDGRGGNVTIGTFDGAIDLAAGSAISTRGTDSNGRLWLRAPVIGNDVNIAGIRSTLTGVDSITVESVLRFDDLGPVLSEFEFQGYKAQADAFSAAAAFGIFGRLSAGLGPVPLRVQTGLDLYSSADLEVQSLDLSSWRFADEPGALTIRSGGSILVNGTISDGFSPDLSLLDGRSATIRLAAGSAFQSTNPLAVQAGGLGDLTFSPFSILRTGTGDIGLAAAGNVLIGSPDVGGASIYTAGIAGAQSSSNAVLPTDGGSISIAAGGSLFGSRVVGGVGEWQPRAGRVGRPSDIPTQWGTNLSAFNWNVGSLGGGDVSLRAGGDVTDLSAAAADSAIELEPNVLTQFRGGVLSLDAGGDVLSAMLHFTRGDNHVRSEGTLGSSRQDAEGHAVGSLFSIADGTLAVRSRGTAMIEGALQPSAIIQSGVSSTRLSRFLTAGQDSALDIQSAGGDIEFNPTVGRAAAFLGLDIASQTPAELLGLAPASLKMASLSGDIQTGGTIMLTPSDQGQLDLFAFHDMGTDFNLWNIVMSDATASSTPTPLTPNTQDIETVLAQEGSGRHINDPQKALITVGHDLGSGGFLLPKAVEISVGRDIVGLGLTGQNVRPNDVTLITAGRDIRYIDSKGLPLSGEITVGGPGRLDILAGRNIDLGFSGGVSTVGSLRNPNLPTSQGADLTMIAGLGKPFDYTDFFDDIVAKSEGGRTALIDYMASLMGAPPLTFDAAAQAFRALDETTQRPFLLDFFFEELVASGREANADPRVGFDRGYAAIDALLPGSRSTDPKAPNPYEGDLLLSFSKIYTLAGGTISLMVPGGLINVGLANPPPNGPSKKASELGIVAQRSGDVHIYTAGDVLVNQSRVFTLGGGDIAIWSNLGDIDAGRGSKTSVSAPPPAVLVDSTGRVTLDFAGAVQGSGIRTITATADTTVKPGDVDLMAPVGTVNAGDAGIGAAGNINIAAQQVVGLDNIQFGGTSTGVPAEVSGLGASLSGASATASSASNASSGSVGEQQAPPTAAPLAEGALGWLDVFVTGFGDAACSANDAECLKREQAK